MSKCSIDHSLEDVMGKLESQKEFLPVSLAIELEQFLNKGQTQDMLNEIFHLLKKYDLASVEEREERNQKLLAFLK